MAAKQTMILSERLELIDQVVAESSVAVVEQLPSIARGLALGRAMKRLRELVNDEVMTDIMELMGSPLGFLTDRDKKETPYSKDVIKDAAIHCLLRGGSVVGNEFNVIASRCYLTKEFYERKVRELVNDLRIIEHVPQTFQSGALVGMEATWVFEGRPDGLRCVKTDEEDTRIAVKTDSYTGVDAILGKAYRKFFARIHRRVTGSTWLEADAAATESATALPGPDTSNQVADENTQEPEPEAEKAWDDGLEDTLQACGTIRQVDEIQKRVESQISDDGQYDRLCSACDARRDAIRKLRGERSNGKEEAVASQR
jgi:hypothetical protein